MTNDHENRTGLVEAGFVETSPGYYERGGAVIRYGPALRKGAPWKQGDAVSRPSFHIFTIGHRVNPSFDSASLGEALLVANAVGDMAELSNAIVSGALSSVSFYLTGGRGLDLKEGPGLPAHVLTDLDAMAANMASRIISESIRAGLITPD